jgi:hypothetical protein
MLAGPVEYATEVVAVKVVTYWLEVSPGYD